MTDTPFEGYAIVEQMGRKVIVGYVREVQLAGVPVLRVDVPDGDKPLTESIKATQFIHASSLYAMTPTTEAIARRVASWTHVEPAAMWGAGALPPGRGDDLGEFDPEEPEDEPDKIVDELLVNHGLAGVLELLIANYEPKDNEPDSDPDAPRYLAILTEARDLADEDGRWPQITAREEKRDQRNVEAVDEHLEERPAGLVEFETTGDPSALQVAAEAAGDDAES